MILVQIIFAIVVIVISVNFLLKLSATVRRLMKRRPIMIVIGIFTIIIVIVIIAKSNIFRLTLLIRIPLLQPILMGNS